MLNCRFCSLYLFVAAILFLATGTGLLLGTLSFQCPAGTQDYGSGRCISVDCIADQTYCTVDSYSQANPDFGTKLQIASGVLGVGAGLLVLGVMASCYFRDDDSYQALASSATELQRI